MDVEVPLHDHQCGSDYNTVPPDSRRGKSVGVTAQAEAVRRKEDA